MSLDLCRTQELESFCFAHFSTITEEWATWEENGHSVSRASSFLPCARHCQEWRAFTLWQLPAFCNSHAHYYHPQMTLRYKLEGSCKKFHKLTWLLKIQLDTLLWLRLHSCWNMCSVKEEIAAINMRMRRGKIRVILYDSSYS